MAKNSKKKVSTSLLHKREQALLDLTAPRLMPQKQITVPLTKITQNNKLKPTTKLVYGELYTIFNVLDKVQLNHIALEKPIGAKHIDVVHALKYLIKLKLIKIIPVKSTHIIGKVIVNVGLNKNSNHLNNLLSQTDYKLHIKEYHLRHVGKLALQYLDKKVNRHWGFKSVTNHKHIMARLHEGYTLDDFKKVVDNMYALWYNDPRMSQYLEPQTLFGTKFDKYLHIIVHKHPANQKQINKRVNRGGALNKYDW